MIQLTNLFLPFLTICVLSVHSRTVLNNLTVSSDLIQDLFFDKIRLNLNERDIIGGDIVNARKCMVQLREIVSQFPSLKVARFADSWGKLPSGLLYGHLTDLGNYDQCIKTSVVLKEGSEITNGQYCLATFPLTPFVPFSKLDLSILQDSSMIEGFDLSNIFAIKLGVCVPDTCNPQLITEIFQKATANVLNGTLTGVKISKCSVAKKENYETVDIFAIAFFSMIGVLMLLSTLYDFFTAYREKKSMSILLAFSVITNGRKLFMINMEKSHDSIDCLIGIRVVSMVWVLFCHSYMFYTSQNLINIIRGLSWARRFWSMAVLMGTVSVDSFFFLSGLLIAWLSFRELDKTGGKLNVLLMWVHRYIRLTPCLAALILFYVTLNKYIGTGPLLQDSFMPPYNQCKETWWTTLLYVQNYASTENMCVIQSWYLAIDTQLFILSPLILIPLWKWGKKFIPVLILIVLLSMGNIIAIFYIEGYKTLIGFGEPGRTAKVYFPTHNRLSPWVVGVVLGYYMHINRQKPIRPHVILQMLGWTVSIVTLLSIVFAPYFKISSDGSTTVIEAAMYESFKRVSWSIALAWIVFACHFGFGGLVSSILSHHFWQPLGRLTYCMYLVHLAVVSLNYGISRTDVYFSDYTLMLAFCSNFAISFLVATVLSLSFEAPVLVIEKCLFGDKKRKMPRNVSTIPTGTLIKEDRLSV